MTRPEIESRLRELVRETKRLRRQLRGPRGEGEDDVTKIAPVLTGFVEDEFSRCIAPETCAVPCGKMRRELRALLAVARAAKRVAREKLQPRPPFTTLDRALASLDRVSEVKP